MTTFNGPLHEMTQTTPTRYWNDSCSVAELSYAIERGASGATSNPVIVGNVLKHDLHLWRGRIEALCSNHPTWTESEIAWQIYRELAQAGASLLRPLFEASRGQRGRLSIQTDPTFYRDSARILAQAEEYHQLAPNMQVKIPATSAGIAMVEEATYLGINLNVTVSFTVPQVLAAGEAIERGLQRRAEAGRDTKHMTPMVTMMVGRTDDWMKVLVKRENLPIDPGLLEWCGVACFKHAYQLYQERGYKARLLAAAYRNFLHWTEFVGGDVTLTMPWEWQVKFNESNVRPEPRMQIPVEEATLAALATIPDFQRAYAADGMRVEEFDTFGATVRTLRSFIEASHTYVGLIRDVMLPNPD